MLRIIDAECTFFHFQAAIDSQFNDIFHFQSIWYSIRGEKVAVAA